MAVAEVTTPTLAGLFRNATAAYTQAYARRPVLTLSLTNGVLSSVSDAVAQGIEATVSAASAASGARGAMAGM